MSQVGLQDLHLATLTQDDGEGAVYENPIKIAGAINATINPTVNTQELYADDQLWESVAALGAVDVEVEVADLGLNIRAILSGTTLEDGVLKESANISPPHVALGFKSLKSDGKYRFVWLLKGRPQPIAEEFATKTDNVEHKTPKMRFVFMPLIYNGMWKETADEDANDFTGGDTWFDAVPVSTPEAPEEPPED